MTRGLNKITCTARDVFVGFLLVSIVSAFLFLALSSVPKHCRENIDINGKRSQVVIDRNGYPIEVRTETSDGATGKKQWEVMRYVCSSNGKLLFKTNKFYQPLDRPCGEEAVLNIDVTQYTYDERGNETQAKKMPSATVYPNAFANGKIWKRIRRGFVHAGFFVQGKNKGSGGEKAE